MKDDMNDTASNLEIPVAEIRTKDKWKLVGSWLLTICGSIQMSGTNLPHSSDEWFEFLTGLGLIVGGLLMNRGVPTPEQAGAMRIVKKLTGNIRSQP